MRLSKTFSNSSVRIFLNWCSVFLIASFTMAASCSSSKDLVVGTKTGNLAPEILCDGVEGSCVPLSSLKGSYVLIEFWASTCNQCRKDHFEMERMYYEYKDVKFINGMGFDIYSIALDESKNDWLESLKNDRMSWDHQFCDTRKWNADAAINYGVNNIPKYFLIDGDGVIVERHININELEDILSSYKSR